MHNARCAIFGNKYVTLVIMHVSFRTPHKYVTALHWLCGAEQGLAVLL